MQLWTHHPSEFRVNDPDLVVDYTKGMYWKENTLRYRKVLPKLHELLGTTQFLWCCTKRGGYLRTSEDLDKDLVEWELNAPLTQILRYYHVKVWDGTQFEKGILGGKDNWDDLLREVGETEPSKSELSKLGVLVRVPLKNDTRAKCHGTLPVYPNRR